MQDKDYQNTSENEVNQRKSIKDWIEEERPREKMIHKGAAALTDIELLAILLGGGTEGRSAVDLARELYENADNELRNMARFTIKSFTEIKGIGPAKAITLMTALELCRRKQTEDARKEFVEIGSSQAAANFLRPMLADLANEVFVVVYLNHAGAILFHEKISIGGISSTAVDVRLILKNALLWSASKLIVAHNHPSGNVRPSQADEKITKKIKESAKIMDIELIDHLIITFKDHFSFADHGML